MRIGVAGTHGIVARRGIPNGGRAGGDLFGGPIRNLCSSMRTGPVRRLSETVNAQVSALGSTKGAT